MFKRAANPLRKFDSEDLARAALFAGGAMACDWDSGLPARRRSFRANRLVAGKLRRLAPSPHALLLALFLVPM